MEKHCSRIVRLVDYWSIMETQKLVAPFLRLNLTAMVGPASQCRQRRFG
jgi:hypothetical protein